jgi:uncharacterized protein (DUF1499 family)
MKWTTLLGALVALPVVLAVLGVLAGQLGLLRGNKPADLGVTEGRLKPPSLTRNSVSSQASLYPDHPQRAYADIAPFELHRQAPEVALDRLEALLRQRPDMVSVSRQGLYIHAEAQTRLMKYVDDLEFWFNPQRSVVEVRSASRLGREDFAANRQRLEALRTAYSEALQR